MRIVLILVGAMLLSGCVRTAAGVVTAPFRAAGQTADWLTTSQDEADRNRGRKMRKQEEKEAREMRRQQREEAKRRRDRRED